MSGESATLIGRPKRERQANDGDEHGLTTWRRWRASLAARLEEGLRQREDEALRTWRAGQVALAVRAAGLGRARRRAARLDAAACGHEAGPGWRSWLRAWLARTRIEFNLLNQKGHASRLICGRSL